MLSGDGTRIALEASDTENRTQDLWILELPRGAPAQFTVDRGNDIYPYGCPTTAASRLAPIGKGAFTNLYEKMSSGSAGEKLLLASTDDNLTGPYDWSPDGRFLLFRDFSPETNTINTGILPLSGDPAVSNLSRVRTSSKR